MFVLTFDKFVVTKNKENDSRILSRHSKIYRDKELDEFLRIHRKNFVT